MVLILFTNRFKPNGISQSGQLDQPVSVTRVAESYIQFLFQ